jgi:outer membrane protein OmpA-like peptidoglycan-associated protein/opacity protein-like surface antigen
MSCLTTGRLGRVFSILPATIAFICMFAGAAVAQEQPAPKWEFSGQYSFWYPGSDVHGTLPLGVAPLSSRLESNPRGVGGDLTYNFNRWFGFTLDASTAWGSGEKTLANRIDDAAFSNLSFGPKITFRKGHFSPFVEALVGDHRLTPDAFHDIDKLGFMFGGGLDINVSRHVALRLLRADYVMSSYRYGPASNTPKTELRGARLQSGLVLMFGGKETEIPVSAACSAQPNEVFAGEPVTATATGSNFNPKRTIRYSWSGTGVKPDSTGASAQIDTTGLQPGSYRVNASLSDGSKHGMASCSSAFTVKSPRPPTITCSADPNTVTVGASSAITSNASSPDGRPLTYSYAASSGSITGNISTATLSTGGAQPGAVTVTCSVSDDRNPPLTASATTTVNVQAPAPAPAPPPPPPTASKLNEVQFKNAAKPARVDNEAKAILDDVALRLQREPDARAVVIGYHDVNEKAGDRLARERAANVKAYLTSEKGIDSNRIEIRTSTTQNGKKAEIFLVPAGATLTEGK